MRGFKSFLRVPSFAPVLLVAACAAPDDSISRLSDDVARIPESPAVPARLEATDGSLAALTAEVRQLRVAVEGLARSQAETQALTVALSAQQDRVRQLSDQLRAAREEVVTYDSTRQRFAEELPNLADQISRTTDRERRADLEDRNRSIQGEHGRIESLLQQARGRESDLSRELAVEEDRWEDLLSRLHELTQ